MYIFFKSDSNHKIHSIFTGTALGHLDIFISDGLAISNTEILSLNTNSKANAL